MDASSLSTFLRSWVDSTRESREPTHPDLVSGSLLPPVDTLQGPPSRTTKDKCIAKRYVFEGAKMASLKGARGRWKRAKPDQSRGRAVAQPEMHNHGFTVKIWLAEARLADPVSEPTEKDGSTFIRKMQ